LTISAGFGGAPSQGEITFLACWQNIWLLISSYSLLSLCLVLSLFSPSSVYSINEFLETADLVRSTTRVEASYYQTSYSVQESTQSLWMAKSTLPVILHSIAKWGCGEISVSSDDNKRTTRVLSKLCRVINDWEIVYRDQIELGINPIKRAFCYEMNLFYPRSVLIIYFTFFFIQFSFVTILEWRTFWLLN
jgi:hypothetical protein